jgi:hypothetical protein
LWEKLGKQRSERDNFRVKEKSLIHPAWMKKSSSQRDLAGSCV